MDLRFLPRYAIAALAGLVMAAGVQAGSGRLMPGNVPLAYVQECGACHLPYPPGLLPARSWQRLMGHLDSHYGSDASLDPATVAQLGLWLQAHAGTYKRVAGDPPQDRITRSAWFERKHRKVDAATWHLPGVKSAANCMACHEGAAQVIFEDEKLRYPPGLSPAQQRAWKE